MVRPATWRVTNSFESWIANYVLAWRTAGTDALAELFSQKAEYLPSPFDQPVIGLENIARFWEADRESPDEQFSFESTLIAVDDNTCVARVEDTYEDARAITYRNLWIVVLDGNRLCMRFEEWPFFPDQPRAAAR